MTNPPGEEKPCPELSDLEVKRRLTALVERLELEDGPLPRAPRRSLKGQAPSLLSAE